MTTGQDPALGPTVRARRRAAWLLSPTGRLLLAVALFGLVELLAIPALIFALLIMPYRGGAPVIQTAPQLFWTIVAVAVGIPAVLSLYFFLRISRSLRRLEAPRRAEEQ